MTKQIYDRFGFDKDGYNKDGYDRMGYNREGYDRQGFDKRGLNRYGINKLTGLDQDGYDQDGYNEDGYDRDGYNREGYDTEGYNKDGFDKDGYDRNGYDQSGYNKDGFDVGGYNRSGYDRDGFNRDGYDIAGYDKSGFNKKGYNRSGYDRDGYDQNGFDQSGYNKAGFDAEGYNREGFDRDGYDRNGFNCDGWNQEGFDCDGYDKYGFNREKVHRNGFDINGISADGLDILGYGKDGFDADGLSADGYSRELFDEEGYHIYTGFNLKGYDRNGFNINGYDSEGYDQEGFHSITGLNRAGFDRNGYGRTGYDARGYNQDGYNRDGYDEEGYDREGFDKTGYDRAGYDKDGYDKRGYDVNGYDSEGIKDPQKSTVNGTIPMDPKQDIMEAAFFKKCVAQIKGYFRDQVKQEVMKDYKPFERTYIDRWGFIQTDIIKTDINRANNEIETRVNRVLREPYFCHVDYKDDCELYIGKQKIHGWVTDWADERASLYYQYQMYIGNKQKGLNFVRDIILNKSQYKGYKDLYNRTATELEVADEHLLQIIAANQKNKKIHDIIESIQQKQYQIITADKDKATLVLGCAGSGKTMILMHKIRYMKYNYPDVNMDNIIVISPTDILGRESKELSKLLQIEKIQQFTTAYFYEKCCKRFFGLLEVSYEEFHVVDNGENIEEYYDEAYLEDIIYDLQKNLEGDSKFLDAEQKKIKNALDDHIRLVNKEKSFITEMQKLYTSSVKEISSCSRKGIERLIERIEDEEDQREQYENVRDIIDFLNTHGAFLKKENLREKEMDEISNQLFYTQKAITGLDYNEFLRICSAKSIVVEERIQLLQILQLFMKKKLETEDAYKVFKEWEEVSEEDAARYITFLENRIDRIYDLSRKKEILQYLLENNMVTNRTMGHTNLNYETSFEKLLKLYDEMEDMLENIGYTPFSYFEEYEKIERKRKRLAEQKKLPRKKGYLFDALLSILGVKYTLDSDIFISVTQAFEMTYILYKYVGTVSKERVYIYIDEFQDFSRIELQLFQNIYSNAVMNLFGDVKQCINGKGIDKVKDIPGTLYTEKYEILENYRNARQIAIYIKDKLGIEMFPAGLNGIQKTVTDVPDIQMEDDDRIAIIVEDNSALDDEIKERYEVNFYTESKEIVRGIYNVIPVKMTKGLEFEKVIVIQRGMSNNEFYVACTRAISELYVIPGDVQGEMIESDDLAEIEGNELSEAEADGLLEEELDKIQEIEEISENLENSQVDIRNYTLVPYRGKLKKTTGIKRISNMYISIWEKGTEKQILICYLTETKTAYVPENIYQKHKEGLTAYFTKKSDNKVEFYEQLAFVDDSYEQLAFIDDSDIHGTVKITPIKEKEPQINEQTILDLETYVFDTTKTVNLMDRFEGLESGKPYDRLIIKNTMYIAIGSMYESISLVVERSKGRNYEGDITFTEFKKGEVGDLKRFIRNQFTEKSFREAKKSGEYVAFTSLYRLRAQNSRNRTGYGWEWDWSDPYDPLVTEGTLYGETTNYVFAGAYVGRR